MPIGPKFKRFNPGPLSKDMAEECNRLARAVEKLLNLNVDQSLTLSTSDATGFKIGADIPDIFLARIESAPDANGAFNWSEVVGNQAYGVADNKPFGRTGNYTVNPSFELNGSNVLSGTYVWMTRGVYDTANQQEYLFIQTPAPSNYVGPTTFNNEVTFNNVVNFTNTSDSYYDGNSTYNGTVYFNGPTYFNNTANWPLTVAEEYTNVPDDPGPADYNFITRIDFNQKSGFIVEDVESGEVRVHLSNCVVKTDDNLLANSTFYYHLEEANSPFLDSSGNNRGANLTGGNATCQASGKINYGLSLEGSGQVVTQHNDYNFAGNWTYLCWFKITANDNMAGSFNLLSHSGGPVGAYAANDNAINAQGAILNGAWDLDEWHFLSMRHNGTVIYAQVDDGTISNTAASSISNTTTQIVWGPSASTWSGTLDEIAFIPEFLTTDQIADIYSGGAGSPGPCARIPASKIDLDLQIESIYNPGGTNNPIVTFDYDPLAVNGLTISDAPTGSGPVIGPSGTDSDIDFIIKAKGAGKVRIKDTDLMIDNSSLYIKGEAASDGNVANFAEYWVKNTTPYTPRFTDDQNVAARIYLEKKGADIASGSNLPVTNSGTYFDVTGNTTITSIDSLGCGTQIKLQFDDALTLVHDSANLVLPSGANITTAAGDHAEFVEYNTAQWRCNVYTKADGTPIVGGSGSSTGLYRVRVATTTNGTLATAFDDGSTVDGVTLATGDLILLKNQTTGTENGVYTVAASGAPTRLADWETADAVAGYLVVVEGEGTVNANTVWQVANDSGSDVVGTDDLVFQLLGGGGPGLLRVTVFTSNGTWNKGVGTTKWLVEVQGPGGGGGGCAQAGAGTAGTAGGGQAGGYCKKLITSNTITSATITIGTGGAGGTAGANNGSSGSGASSYADGTHTLSAPAGVFGSGVTATSGAGNGTPGGSGTTPTGGDINIRGGAGTRGIWSGGDVSSVGNGGSSFLGVGGAGIVSETGDAGRGYGGGGQGAACWDDSTNRAGGNGANGVVIIWEYGNEPTVPATITDATDLPITAGATEYTSALAPNSDGRLTLTSGTPVTTSDVSGASTLYFTPYCGNRVRLYDGTQWKTHTFTERSLALSSLTSGCVYDVFLYDNSGTLTLETAEWDNSTVTITNASPGVVTWSAGSCPLSNGDAVILTTTGALPTGLTAGTVYYVVNAGTDGTDKFRLAATKGGTAINTSSAGSGTHTCHSLNTRTSKLTRQDGVLVKSGATTRLYLGTFRATGTTTTEDSLTKRFVWNNYNRRQRTLFKSTGNPHNYNGGYQYWDNDATNIYEFIVGLAEDSIFASIFGEQITGTALYAILALGINISTVPSIYAYAKASASIGIASGIGNNKMLRPVNDYSLGYNYCAAMESTASGGTSSFNNFQIAGAIWG